MSEFLKNLILEMALAYLSVVTRKHGVTPVSTDDLSKLSYDDLVGVLEHLRDLAHLPPK